MKCQVLFSGKNKKNIINLSSAENAQRVVKVKGLRYEQSHNVSNFKEVGGAYLLLCVVTPSLCPPHFSCERDILIVIVPCLSEEKRRDTV